MGIPCITRLALPKITLLLALTTCSQNPVKPEPVELLLNGSIEGGFFTPAYWTPLIVPYGTLNECEAEWSEEECQSASHSLKLKLDEVTDPSGFAYWYQDVSVEPGSLTGKDLQISAAVRLQNITGAGIYINVFADDTAGEVVETLVSQGNRIFTGWLSWSTFSMETENLPGDICRLRVYLIMPPGVTGTVYFDDISLIVRD